MARPRRSLLDSLSYGNYSFNKPPLFFSYWITAVSTNCINKATWLMNYMNTVWSLYRHNLRQQIRWTHSSSAEWTVYVTVYNKAIFLLQTLQCVCVCVWERERERERMRVQIISSSHTLRNEWVSERRRMRRSGERKERKNWTTSTAFFRKRIILPNIFGRLFERKKNRLLHCTSFTRSDFQKVVTKTYKTAKTITTVTPKITSWPTKETQFVSVSAFCWSPLHTYASG